ncbi:MAG: hypothetical protein EXS63_03515 [Candidatus Omnitrophica bacterium]|nr:hypothetical protein [Candidatus Omnitrophota bacterium]
MTHSVDPSAHLDRLRKLVEMEEAEELQQFRGWFEQLTADQREKIGKALLRLKPVEFHYSGGGHPLITFQYAQAKPIPIYSPDIGDMVSITPSSSAWADSTSGTVYDKTRDTITLALRDGQEEGINEEGIYDLNISTSRGTFKKMYDALHRVKGAKDSRLSYLRDLSFGIKKPESYDEIAWDKMTFFNSHLNEWQKKATAKALAAKEIALVHGPPGTGKTTVLVEIIQQAIAQGQFVFATAPSNTACDQLLECLCKAGIPALRLGHPARIMEHLRDHTLDFKIENHPVNMTVRELEQELHQKILQKERRFDRGNLSREERSEYHEAIAKLKAEIKQLASTIWEEVNREALVVVGTHGGSEDPFLRKRKIDLLVMDEASQASEPMAWIPIIRAEKVILAGDHFQLPPTVRSKEAEKQGLAKTLFERLHGLVGEEWKTLLKVQYRMNEKIMNFSSRQFYSQELLADPSVKNQCLADLPGVERNPATEEPFLFLDTAGRGFEEKLEPGSQSRTNPEESTLLIHKLSQLLGWGVPPDQIAVISPYSAQVRLLSSQIPQPEIEVDSIDGFQGREKEVILVSLVRSNVEGDLGFLNDVRRMNVAMTRAKRKLILIGDSATLGQIPFYRALIEYAESIHGYRSSWEEIL